MTQEFVTYEQALALKELGFDEKCFTVYNGTNILIRLTGKNVGWCFIDEVELIKHNSSVGSLGVSAPLKQQAFRWFREKYKYDHSIVMMKHPFGTDEYQYLILLNEDEYVKTGFNTYEEAEQACLDKLIEICKNK